MPESGSILDVVLLILTTGIGIGALASGAQNWLLRRLTGVERAAMLASGVLLLFPGLVDEVLPAVTTDHMLLAQAAIGRASCRESVCQYLSLQGVAES